MIITGFLGYLNIAQNDLNLQQNNNKKHLKSSFTINKRYYLNKRSFSTKREINPIPTSKIVTDFILEKKLKPIYIYENLEKTSTSKKILE
jgi:hypothetical protein